MGCGVGEAFMTDHEGRRVFIASISIMFMSGVPAKREGENGTAPMITLHQMQNGEMARIFWFFEGYRGAGWQFAKQGRWHSVMEHPLRSPKQQSAGERTRLRCVR